MIKPLPADPARLTRLAGSEHRTSDRSLPVSGFQVQRQDD